MNAKAWAVAVTLALLPAAAAAQERFPARPIRIVVGFAAGSVGDLHTRRIAEPLSRVIGQSVIVDNRPGASGMIGFNQGVKSPPDGYTVTWATSASLSASPALGIPGNFDPVKDFQPLTQLVSSALVLLAHPSTKVRDLQGLVALAKSQPGKLHVGSGGIFTIAHLLTELMNRSLQIDTVHVPYKGSGPAQIALLAGEVQFAFDFIGTSAPHVRSGALVPLFVTGAKRVAVLPEVPTTLEVGQPDLQLAAWGGYVVPVGTPKEILSRLYDVFMKVIRNPEFVAHMASEGSEIVASTPDEFRAYIQADQAKWARVIKLTGIKPER